MPVPTIAPLIPVAVELLMSLINAARKAKELSEAEFIAVKATIDREFDKFPTWDELP